MEPMERRAHKSSEIGIETREDGPPLIKGHAAVFNVIESGGWFREQVAPGAFTESLKEDDIRALWNHKSEIVLGRKRSGTLKLWEDERGLAVEITPPDTQSARDLIESIRRGDVDQMSFGFEIVDRKNDVLWEDDGDERLRTIKKAKLWEVSPVTFPFYKDTDLSVKAEYRSWRDSKTPPVIYKSKLYRRRLDLDLR